MEGLKSVRALVGSIVLSLAIGPKPAGASEPIPLLQVESTNLSIYHGGFITDIVRSPTLPGVVYFATSGGVIHAARNGVVTEVLQLATNPVNEDGLLGMAFPPSFSDSLRVYLFVAEGSWSRILRFDVDSISGEILPWTRELIMEFTRNNPTHVGGQIRFGPDGFLYIGVGDDGAPGTISSNAQHLRNFHGKILRIDPEGAQEGTPYRIPADNPLVGRADAKPEILAWGLRNPWRFAFHPRNGDLYIGDAGEQAREEVNILTVSDRLRGVNFGWPYFEGTLPVEGQTPSDATFTPPAYEYPTESAIIGGDFMTSGSLVDEPLYIFGEFGGTVRTLKRAANGDVQVNKIASGLPITCFGTDHNGELLFGVAYEGPQRIVVASKAQSPKFVTTSGTHIGPLDVGLENPQLQTQLRYTLDGTEPTSDSPLAEELSRGNWWDTADAKIPLWDAATVKVRAFYPGVEPSETISADYVLKAGPVSLPYFRLEDYTQIAPTVYTSGMTIRYTVNDTPVTESSPIFNPHAPQADLWITKPTIVRARAYRSGWLAGDESVEHYTLWVPLPTFQVATTAAGPLLYAPIRPSVSIGGVTFRYTTDGSTPTENSPVYSTPQLTTSDSTLTVGAFKEGMIPSFRTVAQHAVVPSRGTIHQLTPVGASTIAVPGPTLSTPISKPQNVARSASGVLFAVDGRYNPWIWRISNGVSTPLYQGVHADEFMEAVTTPDETLLVVRAGSFGSADAWRFSPPGHARSSNLSLGVTLATLYPEASGSYLVGNPGSDRLWRARPGASPQLLARANGDVKCIAVSPAGEIFVGTTRNTIQKLSGNSFQTIHGSLNRSGGVDGPSADARFTSFESLVFDRIGNLYVVDGNFGGNIRKISPDGFVSTLVGKTVPLPNQSLISVEESTVQAGGSISVDADGIIYGANGSYVWKFVQEDWDNDGIPDRDELQLGSPFSVGRDDRFPIGPAETTSPVMQHVLGHSTRSSGQVRDRSSGIRMVSEKQMLVASAGVDGETGQLEMSLDMNTWHTISKNQIARGGGFISLVETLPGEKRQFFRWRIAHE